MGIGDWGLGIDIIIFKFLLNFLLRKIFRNLAFFINNKILIFTILFPEKSIIEFIYFISVCHSEFF